MVEVRREGREEAEEWRELAEEAVTSDDISSSFSARGRACEVHRRVEEKPEILEAREGACVVRLGPKSQVPYIGERGGRFDGACTRRRSGTQDLRRRVGDVPEQITARGSSLADRISGLWSREVLEHVCGVGFIRQSFDLRRSKIDVTGLLEFVNLGHCTEPRWLRDAVESRSSRQLCVTSDDSVHVRIFFAV
ncbi:hypothetical protein SO802_015441 [Lithocarpus litseifolius]|uniref:Uncharacterized protein n=1 Tax=Lithocarpus litseifolius TaxID=425828 RepID=A0AAW2CXU8_9ROSI